MTLEWIAPLALFAWLAPKAWRRLLLSRAKHRSLAGHSKIAKQLTQWLPAYSFREDTFFEVDGASIDIAEKRRCAFVQLSNDLRSMAPLTLAAQAPIKQHLPDARLTSRYRVPIPFADVVNHHLSIGNVWSHTEAKHLVDLDGNRFIDLTGSYGVNLLGHDFYTHNVVQAADSSWGSGMLLGGYQQAFVEVLTQLKAVSGHDNASFHMSGTEAVMQAVRLARYHSKRRYVVRLTGAYHGWWEDVQPGPGNPMPPRETFTLADMSQRTLRALRSRNDIACVLINPLQALHPNKNAPSDSTLLNGQRQQNGFDREAYTQWLQQLRDVCSDKGIALVFDEVFMGFRLGIGGAQEYFGVQADMVCYGKTLGGGLPVGVVCGPAKWMERFKPEQPAHLCFARGTFNAHPVVIRAMNQFLKHMLKDETLQKMAAQDSTWDKHLLSFNRALEQAQVPIKAHSMRSVWTLDHLLPGRYAWLFQYYLRREQLALSWVGTGRLIFSLDFEDSDIEEVAQRFVRAWKLFEADGWAGQHALTTQTVRKQLIKEMWRAQWKLKQHAAAH